MKKNLILAILLIFFSTSIIAAPRWLHLRTDPIKKAKNHTTIAIFIHGYGTDHSYFSKEDIQKYSTPFPWARITFADAPKQRGLLWWRSFNMGQQGDAAQIVSFLWEIFRHGYRSLVTMAHSRGGAAWITALHMITFPEKHKRFWKKFERRAGYPKNKIIQHLQTLIKNSTSVLVHPLLSVYDAAHCTFKRKFHLSPFSSKICVAAYRTSLSLCSSYSILFPEAIELLNELIKENKFSGDILLCKNDRIVGNTLDEGLLKKNNPPRICVRYTDEPNHFQLNDGYKTVKKNLSNRWTS